jgi:DNA topoisomerase VI subunit B
MDYFTLAGVCKRTGTTEGELAVFGLKENIDNALDFSEVNFPSSFEGSPEIFVDVKYNSKRNYLVMRVRNSNFGLKDIGFIEERIHAIFDDLDRFHSSKRNLFKISRGLQGDALKEEVGIPYALGIKYNGKGEWDEPLIIRN